jgi:hypothetical protein
LSGFSGRNPICFPPGHAHRTCFAHLLWLSQ